MIEFILRHELWIAAVLLALAAACTAHYNVHPGALNTTDSAAYDALFIAEAAIDEARDRNQTEPFSAQAKEELNRLIQSYNIARDAWLTYRGAIAAKVDPDRYFQQLNRNLSELAAAIEAMTKEEVKR